VIRPASVIQRVIAPSAPRAVQNSAQHARGADCSDRDEWQEVVVVIVVVIRYLKGACTESGKARATLSAGASRSIVDKCRVGAD
jgi:hypothetical protein